MAATKTSEIESINLYIANRDHAQISVVEVITWDDPDDADLPVVNRKQRGLEKFTYTESFDPQTGERIMTESATDISGEPQLVQDIAAVVWA